MPASIATTNGRTAAGARASEAIAAPGHSPGEAPADAEQRGTADQPRVEVGAAGKDELLGEQRVPDMPSQAPGDGHDERRL